MKLILNREINQSLWALYMDNFPPEERRTIEKHKAALSDERFLPYEIYDDTDELLGLFYCWDAGGFVYGEHFVIMPEKRCGGFGRAVIEQLKRLISGKVLILEVEPPVDEMQLRRVEFYKREGFCFNDYEYIHPSYANHEPYRLNIMSFPRALTCEEFTDFRTFAFSVI